MEPYYRVHRSGRQGNADRLVIKNPQGEPVRLNLGSLVFLDEHTALDLCEALNMGREHRLAEQASMQAASAIIRQWKA